MSDEKDYANMNYCEAILLSAEEFKVWCNLNRVKINNNIRAAVKENNGE